VKKIIPMNQQGLDFDFFKFDSSFANETEAFTLPSIPSGEDNEVLQFIFLKRCRTL